MTIFLRFKGGQTYFLCFQAISRKNFKECRSIGQIDYIFFRNKIPGISDHIFLFKLAKILLKSQKNLKHLPKSPSSGRIHYVQRFQAIETFQTYD